MPVNRITTGVYLIVLVFICMHCTRDPAERVDDTVSIEKSSLDSSYLVVNGTLRLLVGFDLTLDTVGSAYPQLLREVARSGGNYLKLDPTLFDRMEWRDLADQAQTLGLVLDTGHLNNLTSRKVSSPEQFNRAILAGSGVVAYTALSQRALNSIRAVRAVQRLVDPTRVTVDSTRLGKDNSAGTVAATDHAGNYLLYIPRQGRVSVRLDSAQIERKVTVVGRLGTQRSEVLRPPYTSNFTLESRDPEGGWMVITRSE